MSGFEQDQFGNGGFNPVENLGNTYQPNNMLNTSAAPREETCYLSGKISSYKKDLDCKSGNNIYYKGRKVNYCEIVGQPQQRIDNSDNESQIEVLVNDWSESMLVTVQAQGNSPNLSNLQQAQDNQVDKETPIESGKFVRIIGPLIGFRMGGDNEFTPALNPLKVKVIYNLMDMMSIRLQQLLNFKCDTFPDKIFKTNKLKDLSDSVNNQRNSNFNQGGFNFEKYKDILKGIINDNGIKLEELAFKLGRNFNVPQIDVNNIISYLENNGDDFYVNDNVAYSLFSN